MAALRDLLVSFGVEVDSKDLTGFQSKLSGVLGGIKKVGGVLAGGAIVNGIKNFITDQVETAAVINDTAARLGVTTDELQKFQYAAKMSGIESEAAASSLNLFNKNIGAAASGNGEAAAAFRELGLSVKDSNGEVGSTLELLDGVAEGLQDLKSPQEKAAMLMRLFGKQGAALAPMLANGSAGVADLYKNFDKLGGALDAEYLANAAKVDDAIDNLGFATMRAKAGIVTALLPAVTKLIDKTIDLFGRFSRLTEETDIVNGVLKILAVAGIGMTILKINSLVKAAGGINQALKAAFSLGIKEMVVIGAIILLFLLIEDFVNFVQGNESVVGDFLNQFLGAEEAAEIAAQLRDVWIEVGDAFKSFGPVLADIMKSLGPLLKDMIPYLVKGLIQVIKLIAASSAMFGGQVAAVGKLLHGDFKGASESINKAGTAVFGKPEIDAEGGFHTVGGIYGEKPAPPASGYGNGQIGPPAPNNISNNVTQNNPTTIQITASNDPQATADAVAQKQKRINDQSNREALGAFKVVSP